MTLFARLRIGLSISAAVIVCLLINSCWRLSPELRRPVATPELGGASTSSAQSAAAASRATLRAFGELPQRFEANRGQTDSRFISRGKGFAILLKETEAVIQLRNADRGSKLAGCDVDVSIFHPQFSIRNPQDSSLDPRSTTLRMRLVNANGRPRIQGLDEQPGRSNYFIGGDSRRWITGVPAYSKVRYEQVWPGVDLIWHGAGRQLEHDFIVAPGADPARIRLSFDGPQRMSVDGEGALVLHTEGGELRLLKPVAWQESDGKRREIVCSYRLDKANRVEFSVGDYDRGRTLVIDPVLSYSTYLGGTSTDTGLGIAVDKDGAVYISGSTLSTDFPGASAIQPVKGNQSDAFVLKLNPAGSAIVYATWLGGAGSDSGNSIAVDADGAAYVAGDTSSPDFPVTTGALQGSLAGGADAFVTKLNPAGSALVYSTYVGGNGFDRAFGVALDVDNNAHITGQTDSSNFPTAGSTSARSGSPLFKSVTSGGEWRPSGNGLTASSITGVAIDPANANNINAISSSGLFRSTDGGNQWTLAGAPPLVNGLQPAIISFAVDPKTPATIYLGTTNGVYKSVNGGQSFDLKSTGFLFPFANVLLVDPVTPTTVYAGTQFGAYKTVNGAESWTQINNGLTDRPIGGGNLLNIRKLAIDPGNPSAVYAGTNRGVFKSINGGANWSGANNGFANVQPGLGPDIQALVIDPVSPATLYAGVAGFSGSAYKTTDGGASWRQINTGLSVMINNFNSPLSVTSLAVNPANPAIVYAGSSLGVWKSADGGASWSASNNGLTSSSVNSLQVDPQGVVYAAVNSGTDAFAAKLNATGSALVYSMYLGGTQTDAGLDIAVDAAGGAWIIGFTSSINFPVSNALQPASGGAGDAFITKINPSGSGLAFSTYLGGGGLDEGRSIALDAAGNAYLTGYTQSTNFPTVAALKNSNAGFNDVFVTKMKSDGSGLVYSTYLGGVNSDQAFGVAVDAGGSAWVTGLTSSADFPVVNPLQPSLGGFNNDAFVARLNPAGSKLLFSTYFGGQGADQGNGVAVDPAGNAYVVGNTSSQNFPVLNPLQQFRGADAFVAKFSINADLALAKADSRNPVMVGNDLIYTLTVTNNGPDDAAIVTLTDTLPSGVTLVSSSASQGSCGGTGPVNCDLGDLAANAKATVTITVKPTAVGSITNRANVTSATQDLDLNNNAATQDTRVSAQPSIAGLVTLNSGAGLGGVAMSLSGSQTATATTGAGGFYQFADLNSGGSFSVTPARQGYVFNPPSRAMNNVTQDQTANFTGVACLFTISPINRSFPSSGGSGAIAINGPDPQCPWTARSNAPWITITSAASGNGSGTLNFNVAATTVSRAGSLTVAGNTFTVWQEVNPSAVPDFTAVKRFAAGKAAGAMAAGDFNNDGKVDLAVGLDDSKIAVSLGDGQGGFTPPSLFPSFLTATSLVAADFNGDGITDIAAAGGGVVVLLGTGEGRFDQPMRINAGDGAVSLTVADFNGDNKTDLAVVGGSANVSILFGTGGGGFGAPVNFGNFGATPYPEQLAVGDFNGDNKADLAVTCAFGLVYFLNNGTGGMNTPVRLEAAGRPTSVAAADFNKDGRADLAAPGQVEGKGAVLIFTAAPDGTFNAPTVVPITAADNPPFFVPTYVTAGDLNNDGNFDLVAGSPYDVIPVLNNGAGGFTGVARFTSAAYQHSLLLRDFTGDGRADLVVSNPSFPTRENSVVSLFINDGAGGFAAPRVYPAPNQPAQVISGDFNGDGKLDLLTLGGTCLAGGCANNGSVSLRLGDGQGAFGPAADFTVGNNPLAMAAGDFNGDGRPDVAVANYNSNNVSILLNSGAGGFGATVNIAVSEKPILIAAGDFNGDGKTDLIVVHLTPTLNQTISVLLGDGSGVFGAPTTITIGRAITTIAIGDLNQDGRADLIGADYSFDPVSGRNTNILVMLGDGNGGFQAARKFADGLNATSLLIYDFNGDGAPDVAAPTSGDILAILAGDGMGNLSEPVHYPLQRKGESGVSPRIAARGDFNGDGRPDLAITNGSANLVEALTGNGVGAFSASIGFSGGINPSSVAVGDFNGDGRDDLAVADRNSYVTVLLNNSIANSNNPAASVSAASFTPALAGEAIAAAFGTSLATSTQAATTLPLPTTLAGTTVKVRDSGGVERPASLFYVSPQQVNYQIPPGLAPGGAVVTITNSAGTVSAGTARIESVAPGLFSADSSGQGLAAASVLRVRADGSQVFEPVARYDSAQNKFVAAPIDFGPETDQLFLVLFGTGIRNRSSLFSVRTSVGGTEMEVLYAGAQGGFVGLDQVNVRLLRSLAGRGDSDIVLTADDKRANTVKVNFK